MIVKGILENKIKNPRTGYEPLNKSLTERKIIVANNSINPEPKIRLSLESRNIAAIKNWIKKTSIAEIKPIILTKQYTLYGFRAQRA